MLLHTPYTLDTFKIMKKTFKTIGLIGRQRKENISDTLSALKDLLLKKKLKVILESETAAHLPAENLPVYSRDEIGKHCDLIIVVGGDGSLLNAAHAAVKYNIPILGINRGRLGFLTDIHPSELNDRLSKVLDGEYSEEQRFLLSTHIIANDKIIAANNSDALNDIVLMPGGVAQMIEFSIEIDNQFVCSQRADGLIVATPTGSTAYALSGGGPILHPQLDAVALVPMFPHTLSARPIVISSNCKIKLLISTSNEAEPGLSCDGQERIALPPGSEVLIEKKSKQLCLIHPQDYNYFETLRTKLHWNTKL